MQQTLFQLIVYRNPEMRKTSSLSLSRDVDKILVKVMKSLAVYKISYQEVFDIRKQDNNTLQMSFPN